MAYLVLTLDYAVLAESSEIDNFIHGDHNLSKELDATLEEGTLEEQIHLINPIELSRLFEVAQQQCDGIIILADHWDPTILETLASNLMLSPTAAEKTRSCYFHNILTDQALFFPHLTTDDIYHLPANIRLEKIIAHYQLEDRGFVALEYFDANQQGLRAMPNVHVIEANTDLADNAFYQQTIDTLKEAQRREKTASIPNKTSKAATMPTLFAASAHINAKANLLKRALETQDDEHAPAPRYQRLY